MFFKWDGMRNEFIVLERDYERLYTDISLDEGVLNEMKDKLIYCWAMDNITDRERVAIKRIEHWLTIRASEFGCDYIIEIIKNLRPKPKVTALTRIRRKPMTENLDSFKRGYTKEDRGWLKTLKIASEDGKNRDETDED